MTLTCHACKYKVYKLHQRYILSVTLTWHAFKYKVHKLHQRYILIYKNKNKNKLYIYLESFIFYDDAVLRTLFLFVGVCVCVHRK